MLRSSLTPTILLSLSLLLLLSGIFGRRGLAELVALRREAQSLEQQNQSLERGIIALRRKINRIHYNDFSLEKKAREELGLSYPGEVVYQFSGQTENN